MNQPFNTVGHFDKDTEVGHTRDLAVDPTPHRMFLLQGDPGISDRLFNPERNALVFYINTENNGVNLIAFFKQLRGMLDLPGPMQVRDMGQAVDPFLNLNKDAKISNTFDFAVDAAAHRVGCPHRFPRVRRYLLEP